MTQFNKREFGTHMEQLACDELIKNGYIILCRNFVSRVGEIDIIAKDGDYLCFIEVRYRSSNIMGSPIETITENKRKKIVMTARYYLKKNGLSEDIKCRFDFVSIIKDNIQIYKNIFEAG